VVQFEAALDEQRTWSIAAHIDEAARPCLLVSVHPVSIPPADITDGALGLMIANYELDHGSFEFDPVDGIVGVWTRVCPDSEAFPSALQAHLGPMAAQYDAIAAFAGDARPVETTTQTDSSRATGGWYSTDEGSVTHD
jgi:hypothetical protein